MSQNKKFDIILELSKSVLRSQLSFLPNNQEQAKR